MDWPFALFHGAMCLCATFFAAHVRVNRGGATALAGMMTLGWFVYVLAWTSFNPGDAFQAAGVPITNKDLWSIMDALFAAVALMLAWSVWWGWALWASALVATFAHLLFKAGAYDFEAYSRVLDNNLRAQIALFLLIGGRGVSDRLLSIRLLRRLGRTPAADLARSEAQ